MYFTAQSVVGRQSSPRSVQSQHQPVKVPGVSISALESWEKGHGRSRVMERFEGAKQEPE